MTTRKRSKPIHLYQANNQNSGKENNQLSSLKAMTLKPLALAVATFMAGCSNTQEAVVVKSVADCTASTDLTEEQCETAYQQALTESEKTAPQYSQQEACEAEFGASQCRQSSSGFFIPFMAGWMVSNALDFNRHRYNPVYHYRGSGQYRDRFMTSNGSVLGRVGDQNYRVNRDALTKPMPAVTRTVSRGGFGSQAAAKSNWGRSTGRGWGG